MQSAPAGTGRAHPNHQLLIHPYSLIVIRETCGAWPSNLRMGVGQEGTANYMMVPGNWSYWLWLGSLVPPDLSLQCAAFGDTNATCVDVPAPAMGFDQ